jgi:hypothetical protein
MMTITWKPFVWASRVLGVFSPAFAVFLPIVGQGKNN